MPNSSFSSFAKQLEDDEKHKLLMRTTLMQGITRTNLTSSILNRVFSTQSQFIELWILIMAEVLEKQSISPKTSPAERMSKKIINDASYIKKKNKGLCIKTPALDTANNKTDRRQVLILFWGGIVFGGKKFQSRITDKNITTYRENDIKEYSGYVKQSGLLSTTTSKNERLLKSATSITLEILQSEEVISKIRDIKNKESAGITAMSVGLTALIYVAGKQLNQLDNNNIPLFIVMGAFLMLAVTTQNICSDTELELKDTKCPFGFG